MISVGKDFFLIVSIQERELATLENFDRVEIVEEAGNILPTVKLFLNIKDESILPYLHEGNVLRVTLGKTDGDDNKTVLDTKFRILSFSFSKETPDSANLSVIGLFDCLGYMNDCGKQIIGPCSSLEAIETLCKPYFRFVSTFNSSDDSMVWYQAGRTVRSFVNEVWQHMNLDKSFPFISITFEKELKLTDINYINTVEEIPIVSDIGGIPILNLSDVTQDTSLVNTWYGYGRSKLIYDMDSQTISTLSYRSDVNLAHSKSLPREASISERKEAMGFQNENVFKSFTDSFMKNSQNLVNMSTLNLEVEIEYGSELSVLDPVMFLIRSLGDRVQYSESISGRYLISRRVRKIEKSRISDILTLSRQGINLIKD